MYGDEAERSPACPGPQPRAGGIASQTGTITTAGASGSSARRRWSGPRRRTGQAESAPACRRRRGRVTAARRAKDGENSRVASETWFNIAHNQDKDQPCFAFSNRLLSTPTRRTAVRPESVRDTVNDRTRSSCNGKPSKINGLCVVSKTWRGSLASRYHCGTSYLRSYSAAEIGKGSCCPQQFTMALFQSNPNHHTQPAG